LQYVLAFLTSLQGHGRDQALQLAVFLTLPLQELLWGFRIDKVKEAMKRKFYTDAGGTVAGYGRRRRPAAGIGGYPGSVGRTPS
jgi:hypothetical protein